MKTMMMVAAAVLTMGISAQASEMITCANATFPQGLGSELNVTIQDGKVYEVQLKVHENKPSGWNANGFFRPHFAVNENQVEVIYLSWFAGSYSGAESKNLVPNKMVFYSFDHFLAKNQIYMGVIQNTADGKIETQYRYICQ